MFVSGLGLCSTTLLLTDPPPPADAENSVQSVFSLNSSVMNTQRFVASVDEHKNEDSLFEINCSEAGQTLETVSTRFRLKGQTCAPDDSSTLTTQVHNKSNGYVATVFHRGNQAFSTDYINLSEGKNEIDVRFDTDKGPIDRTLIVVRNPASKK